MKRQLCAMCLEPGCEQHQRNSAGYCAKHTPRTYRTWRLMRERCHNARNARYRRMYQDRGITVDPRWNVYAVFVADVGECPSADHVIHRIDNDGNYTPGNVRWVTRSEHASIHRAAMQAGAEARAPWSRRNAGVA